MTESTNPAGSPAPHILFVIDGLWVGGTERSLADLLPAVRDAGWRVTVACYRHCTEGVEAEVRAAGFVVRYLVSDDGKELRGWRRRAQALCSLLRELRPDLVHAMLFKSCLAARLACACSGTPSINSLVSTSYAPERLAHDPSIRPWRLRAVQAIDALTARLTTHFHAVSETAKHSAMRHLRIPAKRITVVRRGRDPQRYRPADAARRADARRALGLPEDAVLLAHTGRQDTVKRHLDLADAVAHLAPVSPHITLAVAGRRGTASHELDARIAELGIGERVVFLGHLDDVTELLAAADLFVFASIYEGMPGSVIEAMAMGLPIVSSRIPAVEEIVEEGGNALLVPARDARALATAVGEVLADRERAEAMARRSRELFEEHLSFEKSAGRMLDLYERVAQSG